MSGWIKQFTDNTVEVGSDKYVDCKKSSWTKGKLNEISSVSLCNEGGVNCCLKVPKTSWHQFDRFIVPFCEGKHKPIRIYRAMQAKINNFHIGMFLESFKNKYGFNWIISNDPADNSSIQQIEPDNLNKWLTIILPFKGKPLLGFYPKGKMLDDNKQISK